MSTVRGPGSSTAPERLRSGRYILLAALCFLGLGTDAPAQTAAPNDTREPGSPATPAGAAEARDPANPPDAPQRAEPTTVAAETPAENEPAELPPPVTRFETDIEFRRFVEAKRYADALPLADRLIDLTVAEFGAQSLETARVYDQVGDAQRQAGEHQAAADSYLKSIEVFRTVAGPYSPLVIEPMTGLGDNYQAAGEHLSAVSAYGEARTVTRRSFGLLSERQVPLLDRMTTSLVSMNEHVEADQQQVEALRLMERNHPPHSDEALAATYKYAAWLGESGRYQEEREQYFRALRIIRDYYGKDSPKQVHAMRGIGNSFRNQRIPDGQGVSNLREALSLLLAQGDPDELAVAEVLRDLGDWEVAFAKVVYDGAEYRRAWQLLGTLPNGGELRRAWFTGPSYVLREPISLRGLSQASDALVGRVIVRFDIDTLGRTIDAVVVESEPAGRKDESVLRHVRRSRFRPQMADGELVRGTGLALQFNYRYTPDETLDAEGEPN